MLERLRGGMRTVWAVGLLLACAGSAEATVTAELHEAIVSRGRFVRLADVARLSGDPDMTRRLGGVVVSEAPSGGDLVDLSRHDLERRLAELGWREAVRFTGAARIRIHPPGRLSGLTPPSGVTIPEGVASFPAAPSAGSGSLLRGAVDAPLPVLTPRAALPDPEPDEWLPGLRDLQQTTRLAHSALPVFPPRNAWPDERFASGGPAPTPASASALADRGRNEFDLAGAAEATDPEFNDPDMLLCEYSSRLARRREAETQRFAVPAPVGSAAPIEYFRSAPARAGDPDLFAIGENALPPVLDKTGMAGRTRHWADEDPPALPPATEIIPSVPSDAGNPARRSPRGVTADPAVREGVEEALRAYLSGVADAVGGQPLVTVRRGIEAATSATDWRVTGLLSGRVPGIGRFRLDPLTGGGSGIVVEAETAIEAPTVMLRRAYAKDEMIRPEDVFTERRRVDPSLGLLSDPGRTAGHAASRSLAALRPLGFGDLTAPLWIRKRGPVEVRAAGTMWGVTTTGIALEDGRGGEVIRVQGGTGRGADRWFVKVTGPGAGEFVGKTD